MSNPPPPDAPREPLPRSFYQRDKHELALALLGRKLVRQTDDQLLVGRIVEVEVYGGPDDPASHADSGTPTDRTETMFGPPGNAYIYTIYGIHHCLNVVAPARQKAAAVLIRALAPLEGLERMAHHRGLADYEGQMPRSIETNLASGPGKLCEAMAIAPSLDGTDLQSGDLWIARGKPFADQEADGERIESTPRIGLNADTCGEATQWPWRYVDRHSAFLSR